MALPSSGPISLAQVQTEFGGSNPISLSEYYGKASGIPSSGTISLGQFRGKAAATHTIVSYSDVAQDTYGVTLFNGSVTPNDVWGVGLYSFTGSKGTYALLTLGNITGTKYVRFPNGNVYSFTFSNGQVPTSCSDPAGFYNIMKAYGNQTFGVTFY